MDVGDFVIYKNIWLEKPKFLIIYLIVNIILDYAKKTVHNLFTIIQVYYYTSILLYKCSLKEVLWEFKQDLRKIPKKKFVFY